MTIDDIVDPKDRPLVRAMLARKLQGEERSTYELSIRARDGRLVPLEVSTRSSSITASRSACTASPATSPSASARGAPPPERRALPPARRAQHRRHLSRRSDGLVVYASPPVTRMLGYGIEQLVGRHFLDFLHPGRSRPGRRGSSPTCSASRAWPCARATGACHQDGEFRHLEAIGVNRSERAGRRRGRPQLPRRHRSASRRAGAGRERGAVSAPCSSRRWSASPAPSPAAARRSQPRDAGDARPLGRRAARAAAARLFPSPRKPRRPSATGRTSPTGRSITAAPNGASLRRDGQPVWVNLTASMVHETGREPRFGIVMLENITERKQAEAALQDTNRRLADWVAELEQRKRGDQPAQRDGRHAARLPQPRGGLRRHRADGEPALSARVGHGQRDCARRRTGRDRGGLGLRRPAPGSSRWTTAGRLRRGRPHLVEPGQRGLVCKHVGEPVDAATVCVPMLAQGELLGLLHMTLGEERRALEPRIAS